MAQATFSELEHASKRRRTRREVSLEKMDRLVPWERLEKRIEPFYPKAGRGRPPHPLRTMLRVHCVQLLYNLSDPGMEDLLYEVESVRRFAGLRLNLVRLVGLLLAPGRRPHAAVCDRHGRPSGIGPARDPANRASGSSRATPTAPARAFRDRIPPNSPRFATSRPIREFIGGRAETRPGVARPHSAKLASRRGCSASLRPLDETGRPMARRLVCPEGYFRPSLTGWTTVARRCVPTPNGRWRNRTDHVLAKADRSICYGQSFMPTGAR